MTFLQETGSQGLGLDVHIQPEAAGGEVLGGRKRLRILGRVGWRWGWGGWGVESEEKEKMQLREVVQTSHKKE